MASAELWGEAGTRLQPVAGKTATTKLAATGTSEKANFRDAWIFIR